MVSIKKFFKDTFNKGNFKDFFNRNKIFLLFAVCIVILSFVSGLNHVSTDNYLIRVFLTPISFKYTLTGDLGNNILVLFISNMFYSIYTIVMGLSFSIISLLIVVSHEIGLGYSSTPNNVFQMIIDVFVLVGAFLVSKIEKRVIGSLLSRELNDVYSRIKVPLKDLVLSIAMISVWVLLYAIIKALLNI